jgi:hypothetical protein
LRRAFLDKSDSHHALFRRLFSDPPPLATSAWSWPKATGGSWKRTLEPQEIQKHGKKARATATVQRRKIRKRRTTGPDHRQESKNGGVRRDSHQRIPEPAWAADTTFNAEHTEIAVYGRGTGVSVLSPH